MSPTPSFIIFIFVEIVHYSNVLQYVLITWDFEWNSNPFTMVENGYIFEFTTLLKCIAAHGPIICLVIRYF